MSHTSSSLSILYGRTWGFLKLMKWTFLHHPNILFPNFLVWPWSLPVIVLNASTATANATTLMIREESTGNEVTTHKEPACTLLFNVHSDGNRRNVYLKRFKLSNVHLNRNKTKQECISYEHRIFLKRQEFLRPYDQNKEMARLIENSKFIHLVSPLTIMAEERKEKCYPEAIYKLCFITLVTPIATWMQLMLD